jgi:hypothetical protein
MDVPADLQTANRLHLAHKDMEDAKRYLSAMQELLSIQAQRNSGEYYDHCEAIWVAAIVSYCRPFKASRSKGYADKCINPETLECLNDKAKLALHELIETRRDKAIAHGDWDFRRTELLPAECDSAIFRKSPIPDLMSGIEPQAFWERAHQVSLECLRKFYELDRARIQGPGGEK